MLIKHASRISLAALLLAWAFDLLFWQQNPGINFPIIVLAVVAAGLALLSGEGHRPARLSLILIAPALFFAAVVAFRREPFTVAAAVLLTVVLLACLALTLRSGNWVRFNLADWVAGGFGLLTGMLSGGITLFQARKKDLPVVERDVINPPAVSGRSVVKRLLVGLLLAVPVLFVLASLLAEADPAFSHLLHDLLRFLDLDHLAEYMVRAAYIAALGYLLSGVYLYSFQKSDRPAQADAGKTWVKPFLGWIEALVVLVLVDALFALFLGVQVRYFFGGQSNITVEGYTYAEYARRGFNEMFWVVFLSLLLFLCLGTVTRRENAAQRRLFSMSSVLLTGLVMVILISAFQRLVLYETAYGFTRIRTCTHVFMLWVGVLLLAAAVLELAQRQHAFAAALIIVAIGFGLSLSLLNVDGFITSKNIARAVNGEELDAAYLISLSDDAVPVMSEYFTGNALQPSLREDLGGVLACRLYLQEQHASAGWRSFHFSSSRSAAILEQMKPGIEKYLLPGLENQMPEVKLNGAAAPCDTPSWD